MRGNGRGIIQPNAMNIETTYADGPLAQPLCVTVQAPGAMKILALSGLTKVEALAGQIAGHLMAPGVIAITADIQATMNDQAKRDAEFEAFVADRAASLAVAVLAACSRRAQPKQELAQ